MSLKKDVEITLKPFNIKKMPRESIVVLLGKRNTGKSVLVKDILYHKRDIPIGTVISHTDHLTHFYDKFIPGMLIHRRYSPEILTKVFERQTLALDRQWRVPFSYIVLDDVLSDSVAIFKDDNIKEIFFNGRHFKLFCIIAMQSPLALPTSFRTNIDYTFILKNNNHADRERIYKNYAGMFPTFSFFERVLDACTEDYNCLVVDNTTTSNKLEDQVFYYKADMHDDGFKMCAPELWATNNKYYTSNSKKDCNTSVSCHKGTKFIIKKKAK
jgi:hypothetical protein